MCNHEFRDAEDSPRTDAAAAPGLESALPPWIDDTRRALLMRRLTVDLFAADGIRGNCRQSEGDGESEELHRVRRGRKSTARIGPALYESSSVTAALITTRFRNQSWRRLGQIRPTSKGG
jgi:hypothetical protein